MSIFGSIVEKIFGHATANPAGARSGEGQGSGSQSPAAAASSASPQLVPTPSAVTQGTAPMPQSSGQQVNAEAVLSRMASQSGGGGNWNNSIVDLLKLLNLDSSLTARRQLANELNIHVAGDGSAEENRALHKAVMQKLAENGGKVPVSMLA
jgi:pyruvate/2-oxoglutarate dehydrogenase complex dihydrolipoamide acyltransferase (E2) component